MLVQESRLLWSVQGYPFVPGIIIRQCPISSNHQMPSSEEKVCLEKLLVEALEGSGPMQSDQAAPLTYSGNIWSTK